MEKSGLSMKLLVDTVGKRVLFAEAGKECVDFLFFILSLPLSTLIRLLGKKGMVGSLANLYQSIETLNESYLQPNVNKKSLLKKAIAPPPGNFVPLLSDEETLGPSPSVNNKLYTCRYNCGSYSVTNNPLVHCPDCCNVMSVEVRYTHPPPRTVVQPAAPGSGFVKDVVTYMVMDDLSVKPMSTISSIAALKQFNIKDVFALEEREVKFGMTEAVKLLKASLESDKVLTTVFFDLLT